MTNPTHYTVCPCGGHDPHCDDCGGEGAIPCWHNGHGDRVLEAQRFTEWREARYAIYPLYECAVCGSSYASKEPERYEPMTGEMLERARKRGL